MARRMNPDWVRFIQMKMNKGIWDAINIMGIQASATSRRVGAKLKEKNCGRNARNTSQIPLREMDAYARLPAQARMIPAISPMMTAINKIIESFAFDEKDFGLV
jgi:hypothetical protein